ncbi:MAG TPA: hypothetical protein VFP94_01680 [Terriglobales bacterium]|nr:hypothetical protein [Terriglobales bacterium]
MPPDLEPPAPPSEMSEDGVDLTLIRAFLALTPAQRLAVVEDRQDDLDRIWEHLRGR